MPVFDLCPKCGAVSRDGVCSSCGYKTPGIYKPSQNDKTAENENMNTSQSSEYIPTPEKVEIAYNNSPVYYQTQKSKSNALLYAVLGIIGVVVICLVLSVVGVTYYFARKSISNLSPSASSQENSNDGTLDGWFNYNLPSIISGSDNDYIYRYGYYDGHLADIIGESEDKFSVEDWTKMEESAYSGKDPEAYEFDDYVDGSVSYSVYKGSWAFSNEDGYYDDNSQILPHYLYMQGEYVQLRDTGLENEDYINSLIFKKSAECADVAELAVYYLQSDSDELAYIQNKMYVTYMDEKVISLLFLANGFIVTDYGTDNQSEESVMSHLDCITIDLTTGTEVLASETFSFGGTFYETFKEKCLKQNNSAIDFFEDEVLIQRLTDDSEVIWCYTPLGLEVGINRDSYVGWATCTFTDYSDLLKIY